MKKITLKKAVHYRFGVTLYPGRPYKAARDDEGRWHVHLSDTLRVCLLDKNVLTVLDF